MRCVFHRTYVRRTFLIVAGQFVSTPRRRSVGNVLQGYSPCLPAASLLRTVVRNRSLYAAADNVRLISLSSRPLASSPFHLKSACAARTARAAKSVVLHS